MVPRAYDFTISARARWRWATWTLSIDRMVLHCFDHFYLDAGYGQLHRASKIKSIMRKRNNHFPKTLQDNRGEFRWETYFVGGKQKRRKVRMLEGKDMNDNEFISANADAIWLTQEGHYEMLHEREIECIGIKGPPPAQEEDPF